MSRGAVADDAPRPSVEVVYATAAEQRIVRLEHEPGLTAGEAARRSGLFQHCAEAANGRVLLGVYGVPVDEHHVLEPGDRVEICRPLLADPRVRRREAVARGRVRIAS